MFKVRCPANLLWHPSLHQSLLLLRGFQQPHTLILEPPSPLHLAKGGGHLAFPLLGESSVHIRTHRESATTGSPSHVNTAEHIPWMFVLENGAANDILKKELPAYLETSIVSSLLLSKADALLVALNGGEMETTRQLHAALLDSLAQLDDTLTDDEAATGASHQGSNASSSHTEKREEPLSTWPLYTALHFLIEQGGMLTSAFPRIHTAYHRLSTEKAVRYHNELVRKTLESATPAIKEQAVAEYPAKGFLLEVQRRLAEYTTSTEERITEGVTGDHGALRSRVSGGRMGLQTVPARMPWTVGQVPLQRRR